MHSNRRPDAFLPVHAETPLDDVDDLPVMRDRDRACLVQPCYIRASDPARHRQPRLLIEDTCPPARLTSADVILASLLGR
jgi:hypothetical protein